MMIVYFIVKVADLAYRGVLSNAFNGSFASNMFLIEMIVFILAPIFMYAIPAIHTKLWGVLTASILVDIKSNPTFGIFSRLR